MKSIFVIFSLLSLFFSIQTFAQKIKDNDKEIVVTGLARMQVEPDIFVVNIELKIIRDKVNKAVSVLNKKFEGLISDFKEIGIAEEAMENTEFDVKSNRVYRNRQSYDSGFVATRHFKVQQKNNLENIQRMMGYFSEEVKEFTIDFSFGLSDSLKSTIEREVIAQAAKDATEKAEILKQSMGVQKIAVKKIEYGEIRYLSMYNRKTGSADSWGGGGDWGKKEKIKWFKPQKIKVEDYVRIRWSIEE